MSMPNRLASALLVSTLVTALGCSSWREWRRRAAIENVEAIVASQRAAMAIVEMKHGRDLSAPRSRIVVTAEGVHVDNAAWLNELDENELAALDAEIDGELVVHATGLSASSPALTAAVREALAIEMKTFASVDTFVGRAELVVDRTVPFLTLAEVMAAAAEAGVTEYCFAVDTPEGGRFIEAEAPTDCARVEFTKRAEVGLEGYCAVPEIEVRAEGLAIRTRRRAAEGESCEGEIERGPETLEWDGRVMLSDKEVCPSVPVLEGGGQDTKGMVALLGQIAAIVPGCTSGLITGGPGITWEQVAPVVVAVTANSTFVHTALVAEGARAPGADLDCAGGMRPKALPAVAERLAKAKRDVEHLSIMGHVEDLEEE